MAASVRVVDHGADALMRKVRDAAKGARVKVGVIGDEAAAQHNGGGMTVADIASYHEFGIGVPQRSWLREWIDEDMAEIKRLLRESAFYVVKRGSPVWVELDRFGVYAVGSIQARMASGPGSWQELAESTVIRKTGRLGDRTARLIDTGQLRSSITYAVEQGKAGGKS